MVTLNLVPTGVVLVEKLRVGGSIHIELAGSARTVNTATAEVISMPNNARQIIFPLYNVLPSRNRFCKSEDLRILERSSAYTRYRKMGSCYLNGSRLPMQTERLPNYGDVENVNSAVGLTYWRYVGTRVPSWMEGTVEIGAKSSAYDCHVLNVYFAVTVYVSCQCCVAEGAIKRFEWKQVRFVVFQLDVHEVEHCGSIAFNMECYC